MVKEYIRNRRSQKFLTKEGGWTGNTLRAWCFDDPVEAVKIKNSLHLHDADLCFREEDGSVLVIAMCPPLVTRDDSGLE